MFITENPWEKNMVLCKFTKYIKHSAFLEYLLVYDYLCPPLFFLQVLIHTGQFYRLTCDLLTEGHTIFFSVFLGDWKSLMSRALTCYSRKKEKNWLLQISFCLDDWKVDYLYNIPKMYQSHNLKFVLFGPSSPNSLIPQPLLLTSTNLLCFYEFIFFQFHI